LLDVLNNAGLKIETTDLRLWLNNADEYNNDKNLLEERCKDV